MKTTLNVLNVGNVMTFEDRELELIFLDSVLRKMPIETRFYLVMILSGVKIQTIHKVTGISHKKIKRMIAKDVQKAYRSLGEDAPQFNSFSSNL